MIGKKSLLTVVILVALPFLIITCKNSADVNEEIEIDAEGFASPRTVNPNPSPDYLLPEESLKTFRLPIGYHLELVASEPMIKEPVAIAWDGNARMYVAQMET